MTNNYINLQDDDTQNIFANNKEQEQREPERQESSENSNQSSAPEKTENNGEMSDIEMEMFTVAESAFNRKRAQAHEEIDKLYDEMIRSARGKVKGITASIVAEVSGQ